MVDKRYLNLKSELTRVHRRHRRQFLRNRRFRPIPPRAAMSKREFAISLGVGISTIEAAIRKGDLEAMKIGDGQSLLPRRAMPIWRAAHASSMALPSANFSPAHETQKPSGDQTGRFPEYPRLTQRPELRQADLA